VARQPKNQLNVRNEPPPPTFSVSSKLSPALRELHPQAEHAFRDAYFLEFLGLPTPVARAGENEAVVASWG
jgi:hypothetical protein